MRPAGGSLCVLALSLSACAQISDRVVLLPGPDGRSSALSITAAGGEFSMPPTDVTASIIDQLNDTCGNLVQLTQLTWQG